MPTEADPTGRAVRLVKPDPNPVDTSIEPFTRLAGDFVPLPRHAHTYRVGFRKPHATGRLPGLPERRAGQTTAAWAADSLRTVMSDLRHNGKLQLLAGFNILFEIGFFVWLMLPSHHPLWIGNPVTIGLDIAIIVIIGLMELLRLVNVISLSIASVIARYPIPVEPESGHKTAFLTSFVPGKEPLEMLATTLGAARRLNDPTGLGIDVWVLDEGDDPEVKRLCQRLGVRHFSRRHVQRYQSPSGAFKAKSKHGNYNAWLDRHGERYEFVGMVDTDHVPHPAFFERLLGYFRDPEIAFVAAPQVYGNASDTFVTMGAESQQFPFHSTIQPAANTYGCAMFVGTNNVFRVAAMRQIGGFVDSVTEDMATGLMIQTTANPVTRKRWRAIYSPDVLAVGEGPSSWGDFFKQQARWSLGTFVILRGMFWRRAWRLRPGHFFHYSLITTFYPSMALGWLMGALNVAIYAFSGAGGLVIPVQAWLALYLDATFFQLTLYVINRRYNVSPFEKAESYGLQGMLMSIFAAPVFAGSLLRAVTFLPNRFNVTPKGASANANGFASFMTHWFWAVWFGTFLFLAFRNDFATPASSFWPLVAILICLCPPALALVERFKQRRELDRSSDRELFIVNDSEVAS